MLKFKISAYFLPCKKQVTNFHICNKVPLKQSKLCNLVKIVALGYVVQTTVPEKIRSNKHNQSEV